MRKYKKSLLRAKHIFCKQKNNLSMPKNIKFYLQGNNKILNFVCLRNILEVANL